MDTAGPNAPAAPSGTQWRLAHGGHHAVVVEIGGGLREYEADGVPVVDGYAEGELCPGSAGQILAPWPNRIRDGRYAFDEGAYQLPLSEPSRHNAIHGLVSWLRWTAVDRAADLVTLECLLPATPGYPWPLLLRTTWSLGSGGLTARHEVTNLARSPAPFGLGVHPYVRPPGPVDDTLLRVPARSRLLLDARLLPIGAAKVADGEFDFTTPRPIGPAVLDTAFGDIDRDVSGRSAVTVSGADGGGAVTVWADEAFRWWQVFTGDTLSGPRLRRAVAVEPMTCPPDAFRSRRDVVTLEPGGSWHGSWGIHPGT